MRCFHRLAQDTEFIEVQGQPLPSSRKAGLRAGRLSPSALPGALSLSKGNPGLRAAESKG